MPTFSTAAGEIDLEVGDDLAVTLAEGTVAEGTRAYTGAVTALDAEQNAVWIRGVRVDMATAQVSRKVDTDAPDNLTPPPQ